jgi:DNA-binding response OmpR family regulator
MRNKILVVDDEPDVLRLVATNLEAAGFAVITAADGSEGLSKARSEHPDLILLDLMLPGMSGLEVCRKIRAGAQTSGIFTVMLTARTEEYDRIVGFELGADDYICKPFSPRELVLRVKSVLRGASPARPKPSLFEAGPLRINRLQREVLVNGVSVPLTSTEFSLLAGLAEQPGRVLTRQNLLDRLWGAETNGASRTVDVHVRHLREKLGAASECIETVRGFGYRLRESGEAVAG